MNSGDAAALTSAVVAPRLAVARHEAAHVVALRIYRRKYPQRVVLYVTDDLGTGQANGRQGATIVRQTGMEILEIRVSRDRTEDQICWILAGPVQDALLQNGSPDWWSILLNPLTDDLTSAYGYALLHEPNLRLARRWLECLCHKVAGFLSEPLIQTVVSALAIQLLRTPDMDSSAIEAWLTVRLSN